MDVNLRSVLFLSQCVAKDMVERGEGGAIVNVSSQAAQRALPEHTVYCESGGEGRGGREEGEGGAIVNVSSQAAQCALPEHTVYCESGGEGRGGEGRGRRGPLSMSPARLLSVPCPSTQCTVSQGGRGGEGRERGRGGRGRREREIIIDGTLGTAKAGLDMLTKMMGLELGPHKVGTMLLPLPLILSPSFSDIDSCECSEPYCCPDSHGATWLVRPKEGGAHAGQDPHASVCRLVYYFQNIFPLIRKSNFVINFPLIRKINFCLSSSTLFLPPSSPNRGVRCGKSHPLLAE